MSEKQTSTKNTLRKRITPLALAASLGGLVGGAVVDRSHEAPTGVSAQTVERMIHDAAQEKDNAETMAKMYTKSLSEAEKNGTSATVSVLDGTVTLRVDAGNNEIHYNNPIALFATPDLLGNAQDYDQALKDKWIGIIGRNANGALEVKPLLFESQDAETMSFQPNDVEHPMRLVDAFTQPSKSEGVFYAKDSQTQEMLVGPDDSMYLVGYADSMK